MFYCHVTASITSDVETLFIGLGDLDYNYLSSLHTYIQDCYFRPH